MLKRNTKVNQKARKIEAVNYTSEVIKIKYFIDKEDKLKQQEVLLNCIYRLV